MRRLLVITTLAISAIAQAAPINVLGANITFEPPADFTRLSTNEIALKWPSTSPPAGAVGNARRTTTIAYELKPDRIELHQLPELKQVFEQNISRLIPGLVWKEHKVVRIHNQDWIWLEMTSHAIDTDIYNIMLATSRHGRLLIFNFNSTKAEFPAVESALRRSIQSIKVDAP